MQPAMRQHPGKSRQPVVTKHHIDEVVFGFERHRDLSDG
jgi:hypothetical protein